MKMKKTALTVMLIMAVLFIIAGFAWAGFEGASNTGYGLDIGAADHGVDNSYFGHDAGHQTTGNDNTFIGYGTGVVNITGSQNTYVGSTAGGNASASDNTFIGYAAGFQNTGSANTIVGSQSGYVSSSSNYNTYIGFQAGHYNDGSSNVFIGNNAGAGTTSYSTSNKLYIANSNTTTPLIYGEFNTPLVKINGSLQVTSGGITFPDGYTQTRALFGSSFDHNTWLGHDAGADLSVGGAYNTFMGEYSGTHTNSGQYNAFFGRSSGGNNTTGSNNTSIGTESGFNNSGSSNVFLGHQAGYSNYGSNNVFIGKSAGQNIDGSNKLVIANSSTTTPLIWGDFSTGVVKINGQFYIVSDERFKKNIEPLHTSLDKVMGLKGVSYEWKEKNGFGRGKDIGFIAQDVEKVIPELVHTDNKGYKSIAYDKITPVLVEAIKEQQKTIAEKSKIIDEQQIALKELKGEMTKLVAEVNKLKSKDMSAQK
jgi:trimeric autotransporter adhesin